MLPPEENYIRNREEVNKFFEKNGVNFAFDKFSFLGYNLIKTD